MISSFGYVSVCPTRFELLIQLSLIKVRHGVDMEWIFSVLVEQLNE